MKNNLNLDKLLEKIENYTPGRKREIGNLLFYYYSRMEQVINELEQQVNKFIKLKDKKNYQRILDEIKKEKT